MKEKILKIILVSILIMTLAMFDFILLGQNIAIAIAEGLEEQQKTTSVENVEFDAYLKQGEYNVHEKEAQISSEEILILDINVKKRGVLNNGKIAIKNANFKIQKDKIQNNTIKNINLETNEIELNSIIYQNNVKIEIPIVFNKQEKFEADYFQKEMLINLEGTYKDETEQKVEAQRKIKINWTQNDADILLSQNFNKYMAIHEVGTLLQQEITTEVTNNALPREDETLLVQVPTLDEQQPKEIYVIANGIRLPEDKIEFTKETNVLEIKNTNSLSWGKASKNYQVIYLYDQAVSIQKRELELNTLTNTKLFTKEAIQKQEKKSVEIEAIGNNVSIKKSVTREVYKGYIYAKAEQETIFAEDNTLQITNKEEVKEIEVSRKSEEFSDDVNVFTVNDNVIYKSTRVKKDEFDRILGENGQIVITDENDITLGQINQESVADENGNIEVNYEKEVKNIKVTTTKPITEGEFTISHTRAIKGELPYTKEKLKTFNKVITKTKVKNGLSEEVAEAQMLLKDTKTEAKLEVSNTALSTLQTNENIHFLLTLKSDSAEYDLYKNPSIKIILPADLSIQVKNITQLNAQEELKIVNPKLYENENKEKIIEMQLQGEQTSFANTINEGIQISITSDINIDKTVPSKDSEIKMLYTNENRQGKEFSTAVPISLTSKYGVLMVNKVSNYNQNQEVIESIDDKLKVGKLDVLSEARETKEEISIVNNYENDITNVVIVGKMPSKEETKIGENTLKSTFEMELKEGLELDGKPAKIYYSEDSNATQDSSSWKEEVQDLSKVRAFKVQLEENPIKQGEAFKLSYGLEIPEGLNKNQSTYSHISVNYQYLGDSVHANSTIALQTEEEKIEEKIVTEEETNKMKIEWQAKTGGKALTEGQKVYEGQGIKYILKVTNTSEEEIKNFAMVATQENSIFYDEKVYHDGWDSVVNEYNIAYTRIEENPDLKEKKIEIESIKPGETIEIAYQFSVKEVNKNNETTSGKIQITADGLESKEIPTLNNPIQSGKLKLQMRNKYEEEYEILTNRDYPFFLDITNISDETQRDVMLYLPVPEGFEFRTSSLFESDDYEFIEYKNREIIFKVPTIQAKQTISIRLGFQVKSMDYDIEKKSYNFTYRGILGEETYISNEMSRTIYNAESNIEAKQYGSIDGEWVKNGDKLTYTTEIENKGIKEKIIDITDYVPIGAEIQKARVKKYNIINGKEEFVSEEEIALTIKTEDGKKEKVTVITHNEKLSPNEKIVLIVDTVINADEIFKKEITNEVVIRGLLQDISCNSITYKVKGKEDINPNPEMTYDIQGVAWIDENKNGFRETSEEKLKDINVLLIKEETGEIVLDNEGNKMKIKTNENGEYQFENLKEGKYFVVFQYDDTKYRVTEYQKEGISKANNSDVITKTISLEGKEQQVAMTGTLEIANSNLENIDAGFIKGEKFDLRLDKFINKVIIQNDKGTTVKQYNKTQLAKIEIDSKQINNTSIIVEYSIQVTNEGEVAGYVNEVVDYKPTDLSFSSEMNKNWYQSTNGNLCSKELSNQLIKPGETKTINLTLVKVMNQNNTGTIINTAEINKASNDYSIQDIDSMASNKISGEDDMSTAELIISIRTGSVITYISLIITIIVIIAIGIYFIKIKVLPQK